MARIIEDNREKENLLEQMVAYKPQLSVTAREWAERFHLWTILLPVTWTIDNELGLTSSDAKLYQNQFDNWHHSGKGEHNKLGMSFAWRVLDQSIFDEFSLSDSPDFSGLLDGKKIVGDIGKCTPIAMFQGLHSLNQNHNLWISVLNYSCQVILEFGYCPGQLITNNIGRALGRFDREQAVKDAFWCYDCKKWTITQKSRDLFWRDKRQNNNHNSNCNQLSLGI